MQFRWRDEVASEAKEDLNVKLFERLKEDLRDFFREEFSEEDLDDMIRLKQVINRKYNHSNLGQYSRENNNSSRLSSRNFDETGVFPDDILGVGSNNKRKKNEVTKPVF